jgi:trigger factor
VTGAVASLDELKAKIKEDAESQFCTTNRPKLADVTEFLISSTKFDLPSEFLKKWLKLLREKLSVKKLKLNMQNLKSCVFD